MTRATMLVFTSPTCPACPAAKELTSQLAKQRDDFVLKNVVSGMPGSNGLFKKHDVVSVPTIIIKGPGYPQNIGLRGAQPIPTLNKYLDMALGVEQEEATGEKPRTGGFFGKIKSFFAALEE